MVATSSAINPVPQNIFFITLVGHRRWKVLHATLTSKQGGDEVLAALEQQQIEVMTAGGQLIPNRNETQFGINWFSCNGSTNSGHPASRTRFTARMP